MSQRCTLSKILYLPRQFPLTWKRKIPGNEVSAHKENPKLFKGLFERGLKLRLVIIVWLSSTDITEQSVGAKRFNIVKLTNVVQQC